MRDLFKSSILLCLLLELFLCKELTVFDLVRNNYDRNRRPKDHVEVLNITTQIGLLHMRDVSDHKFTFEVDLILRLWWHDGRLAFPANSSEDHLEMSTGVGKIIWVPSVVILNSEEERVQDFMRFIIRRNGDVYWSRRIVAKCSCKMQLEYYPMDVQRCPVELEEYTFSSEDVNVIWHSFPVINEDEEKLSDIPGFTLDHIGTGKFYNKMTIGGNGFNYDRLSVYIHIKRMYSYFIYRVYIPSILLMAINISSYWLPRTAVPARIGLIVTTFLTNTFILQSVTEEIAKVPYTTSLQLFLVGNIVFLVVSIFEYLIVIHLSDEEPPPTATIYDDDTTGKIDVWCDTHWLDMVSRYSVPPLYVVFITVYFVYYLMQRCEELESY